MSQERFLVALKSTIDKAGVDLGKTFIPPLPLVDLDDTVNVTKFLQSGKDGLVWEYLTLEPLPRDPLYSVAFRIGARTTNDASNYSLLGFAGAVKRRFREGEDLTIHDYSSAIASSSVLGILHITQVMVDPQQFDRESCLRLVMINGRAIRWG